MRKVKLEEGKGEKRGSKNKVLFSTKWKSISTHNLISYYLHPSVTLKGLKPILRNIYTLHRLMN